MRDAQDWGRILNQRQKLFGQPVVPFVELNKLVKEFEPYRNLWVTASGKFYLIERLWKWIHIKHHLFSHKIQSANT